MRQPIPFGKYVLLERISVGGMAEVFRAKPSHETGTDGVIAIKKILPSMAEDADFITMFTDEARIAGQLDHQHIARIYELGRVDDAHFIAMEFVWGKDLLQIQNRFRKLKSRMSIPMAVFVASKMCAALDYAHRKAGADGKPLGIIHRDVSPQNVLVSYDGQVKVIDFGIARAASRSTKTQAGVLKGKFGYMSPEQVGGLPLDHRSDVFAIGTILYELLMAERLFLAESDFATLEKVRNVDVPAPSTALPDCPAELERILLKSLAKQTEDRYPWAADMEVDLLAFLATLAPPFGETELATWMREQFAVEMKRESEALDEQLQHATAAAAKASASGTGTGPGGLRVGSAAAIHASELQAIGAAAMDAAAGSDEGAALGGDATMISEAPSALMAEIQAAAAAAVSRVAETSPISGTEATRVHDDDMGMEVRRAVLAPGGGTMSVPGEMPSQATAIMDSSVLQPPPPARDSSQLAMHPATSHVTALPFQPRRSTVLTDVLMGIGVAGLLVGAVLFARGYLREPSVGTLVVTLQPPSVAEVYVDGQPRGAIEPGKALTVKEVAAGSHRVRVHAEAGEHEETVVIIAKDVAVVNAVVNPVVQPKPMLVPVEATTTGDAAAASDRDAGGGARAGVTEAGAMAGVAGAGSGEKRSAAVEGIAVGKPGDAAGAELGHLSVKSEPPGAEVNVNGKPGGTTPSEVDAVERIKGVRVTVRKAGFKGITRYVSFDKEPRQELDVKLEPERGAVAAAARRESRPEGDDGAKKADPAAPPATVAKPAAEARPKDAKDAKDPGSAVTDAVARAAAKDGKPGAPERGAKAVAAAKPEAANATDGFLVANTTPWAKVFIDGKDTGMSTPIAPRSKLSLKPGKHTVTFNVNGRKYNFDVDIKAGEISRLAKVLEEE